MSSPLHRKPQIVIVGGGFGGVRAARRFARSGDVDVTLISAGDNFAYYPQLYHSATGGSRSESSLPLSALLAGTGVSVVRDTIIKLDPPDRSVTGASGSIYKYDELILALGSVTNYFGIQGLKEFSYDIKTIEGAERFKKHLHSALIEDKKTDLNYVVVGGGPTGVELAAALGDYLRRITKLHGMDKPVYKIDLVEAAPRLLPRSPESFSERVKLRLESLGVSVMTGASVEAETADALKLKGESISSKTVVWTAGVSNNAFFKDNSEHFALAKNGKVQVDEYLQARPAVYVIGDNAATQFSGMAQTAIGDADFVVANILRKLRSKALTSYAPKAPVTVIPVGSRWAATQWGKAMFYGLPAHILRRLADLVAYSEIESWTRAIQVWLTDSRRDDICPICAQTPPGNPTTSKT